MSNFNNWGAPVPGATGLVEQQLGKAYPIVRSVALKLELISLLAPRLDIVETVALNIANVMNVARHIPQFNVIDQKLGVIDQQMAQALLVLNHADEYVAAAGSAANRAETAALQVGNLSKALLVFPTLVEAQAAAPLLPDGQSVVVESEDKSYKMDDGQLSSPKSINLGGVDPVAYYIVAKS